MFTRLLSYFGTVLIGVSITMRTNSLFRPEHLIFSSSFNITKILVPVHQNKFHNSDISDIPTIFFTVSDQKMEGGSCVYVLEDFASYEVLEGGRDSTADYSNDKSIYIGARDGIYKYNEETISAKRLGPFKDDIIQIQKANGTDTLYILTANHKIYKIEKEGTIKTRLTTVLCALEFVLDVNNNIYYIDCTQKLIYIVKTKGNHISQIASVTENFKNIKLLRPAFIMEHSVPFFANGVLHLMYSNGTYEKKDFYITEKPTAFSVDTALYVVVAVNGKIYEYNVMDDLLKAMFNTEEQHNPTNMSRLILSVIDSAKDGLFGMYKGWYK